ncbi:transmembrane protein 214 isoform X2 [Lycorma delicatula]|uniref:transmembrane protein 214 isoform X2 n=1 Tax=Lycorma delicatula TaxID=130591 RepID=UPI003F50E91E
MSGQWEVVGKGKKDKHNNKKLTKSEKKKFVDNAPKVEDLLPLSQVKTLYSALDSNKETNKSSEKAAKTKENEAKKTQKKQQENKKEKEPVKEKPPKNLEAAISLLKQDDLAAVIEIGKENFKSTPLVWLKGLASFLNVRLPVEHRENNFSTKSFEHPLCLLPSDMRNLIKREIKEVYESYPNVIQLLFDYCLTSMAVDLAKGSPVCGFKMLLQLLAAQYPSIAVANVDKYIALRNSYQNKQAIGISILWALGQGGFKDLSVGLKVWQNVMLPVCEMRSYTRYVLDYIKVLLARHSTSKALGSEQYFSIIDSIYSPDLRIPNPASVELRSHTKQLREIACNLQPDKKLHTYFVPLTERIGSSTNPLKDDLVRFSVSCLTNDHQTFSIWKDLYADNLPQSACVLKNLNSDWNSVIEKVPKKLLIETLTSFKSINDSMIRKNQKGAGLQDCTRLCEALLKKMSSQRSSFPVSKFILIIFLSLGAIVYFDVTNHGSFKASSTGRFTKDIGIYPHVESAIKHSKIYFDRSYDWGVKNIPVYYKKTVEVSKPYLASFTEYSFIVYKQVQKALVVILAYAGEKLAFISQWVSISIYLTMG